MKEIALNEKTKKIIAWIMLIIMGILSAIGILTCISGIYSCATKEKAEIRQVYAAENDSITFQLPNMVYRDINKNTWISQFDLYITFTTTISVTAKNKGTGSANQLNGIKINTFRTTTGDYQYRINVSNLTWAQNTGSGQYGTSFTGLLIDFKSNNFTNLGSEKAQNQITIDKKPTYCLQKNELSYYEFGGQGVLIEMYIQTENAMWGVTGTSNYINAGYIGNETEYKRGYKDGNANKEAYGKAQREAGMQEGIAQANKYSFTGLISAVFDVPIQTLYGMLNFEILGVNILTVITSVLSIGLIIFVLKLIFG